MVKYFQCFLVVGLLMSLEVSAQLPVPVERKSIINLDLKRSSSRSFSVVLAVNDIMSISAQAEGKVNLKISDPNGEVIFQGVMKSRRVEWQKTLTVAGSYTIEVESVALLLNTRISLSLSVLKPDFSYGDPSMDTLVSKRSKKVLVDGEFEINRKTPKTYTYSVQKGDTLIFTLNPISKSGPVAEIQNDLNEIVFANFSSKKEQYVEIPVFETGAYSITINSSSFLPKTNYIKVELISPDRYEKKPEPPEEPEDTEPIEPAVLFDTIPEVYMDTILFLGAQRDIINPSRQELKFVFEESHTITKWLILYGAGKEFLDSKDALNPILEGEPLAAGATTILAAHGLGFLKKLPNQGNYQIKFTPSASIKYKLKPPVQSNYATMENAYGRHSLLIENKSQSSGFNAYVQVVVFRKVRLDSQ